MSWDPQVGQTWRTHIDSSTHRTYLQLQARGQDSNYFRFVGLDLERGGTFYVNILNSPSCAWELLS